MILLSVLERDQSPGGAGYQIIIIIIMIMMIITVLHLKIIQKNSKCAASEFFRAGIVSCGVFF